MLGSVHTFLLIWSLFRPSSTTFMNVLKKQQNLTDWKKAQRLTSRPPPPQQKKWRDYSQRLNTIIDNYDDYDRLDYLKCVGTMILNV